MTNRKIVHRELDPQVAALAAEHGQNPESVLEILTALQDRPGGLNAATLTDVGRSLGMPAHKVYGVATFFSMLSLQPRKPVMRVCDGPVCWLKRAAETRTALERAAGADWTVERSSCLGLCDRAPAVLIGDEQAGPIEPEEARRACQGWRGVPTDYSRPRRGEVRVMLARAGKIDPDSLESALAHGAYEGLKKALHMKPEEVIALVEASGLQGRGGAGFPVGRKWKFVAQSGRTPRYVICNADESEPLIFKDRVLIDTDPHQLLEGMAIAGYAIGAAEGYIYIRGEYPAQAARLERAIAQAEAKGYLGMHILGTEFSFHVHVHRGAGAYICGEETALIEAMEGKRGEPRLRPPYPPQAGYHGLPTTVNNVESFCAAANIVREGADWWKGLSSYSTPGTKMYMVLGHVRNPGLFEAPFGLTLRQIIEDFGGGMLPGSEFHFALAGGAAGTIVPSALLDVPIDFASAQKGISLGAGAFLVCDQTVSPVAFLREELRFFAAESCGKCTPCRVGTWRAFDILCRMTEGGGRPGDVAELKALATNMLEASFCGLGQSVYIPMHSAMTHFAEDFARAENVHE